MHPISKTVWLPTLALVLLASGCGGGGGRTLAPRTVLTPAEITTLSQNVAIVDYAVFVAYPMVNYANFGFPVNNKTVTDNGHGRDITLTLGASTPSLLLDSVPVSGVTAMHEDTVAHTITYTFTGLTVNNRSVTGTMTASNVAYNQALVQISSTVTCDLTIAGMGEVKGTFAFSYSAGLSISNVNLTVTPTAGVAQTVTGSPSYIYAIGTGGHLYGHDGSLTFADTSSYAVFFYTGTTANNAVYVKKNGDQHITIKLTPDDGP